MTLLLVWPGEVSAESNLGETLLDQCVSRTVPFRMDTCAGLLRDTCRAESESDAVCTGKELLWWERQIEEDRTALRSGLDEGLLAAFDTRDLAWQAWRDADCDYAETRFEDSVSDDASDFDEASTVAVFCRFDLTVRYAKSLAAELFTQGFRESLRFED